MKFKFLISLSLILALSCFFLGYLLVDRSISLSYSRDSLASNERSLRQLEHLLEREWFEQPESIVIARLRAEIMRNSNNDIVLTREGDEIWFDNIRFRFKDGKLGEIGR